MGILRELFVVAVAEMTVFKHSNADDLGGGGGGVAGVGGGGGEIVVVCLFVCCVILFALVFFLNTFVKTLLWSQDLSKFIVFSRSLREKKDQARFAIS